VITLIIASKNICRKNICPFCALCSVHNECLNHLVPLIFVEGRVPFEMHVRGEVYDSHVDRLRLLEFRWNRADTESHLITFSWYILPFNVGNMDEDFICFPLAHNESMTFPPAEVFYVASFNGVLHCFIIRRIGPRPLCNDWGRTGKAQGPR